VVAAECTLTPAPSGTSGHPEGMADDGAQPAAPDSPAWRLAELLQEAQALLDPFPELQHYRQRMMVGLRKPSPAAALRDFLLTPPPAGPGLDCRAVAALAAAVCARSAEVDAGQRIRWAISTLPQEYSKRDLARRTGLPLAKMKEYIQVQPGRSNPWLEPSLTDSFTTPVW
jgi:hypothetical protein